MLVTTYCFRRFNPLSCLRCNLPSAQVILSARCFKCKIQCVEIALWKLPGCNFHGLDGICFGYKVISCINSYDKLLRVQVALSESCLVCNSYDRVQFALAESCLFWSYLIYFLRCFHMTNCLR